MPQFSRVRPYLGEMETGCLRGVNIQKTRTRNLTGIKTLKSDSL